MDRRRFTQYLLSAAAIPVVLRQDPAGTGGESWVFKADVAESCSCSIPCPCNFGHPTERMCNGSRLIQIREGRFGDEDLSGVSFVVTFGMGQWTKIYVDDRIDDRQMAAFEGLFPLAFAGFHRLMRSIERVPMEIERSATTVRYSVPESTVEIELVQGLNGQPITVDGLPSTAFVGYTQYQSRIHRHKSEEFEFSYTNTNGFTSRMEGRSG
jgi:hypothetical protein